MAFNNADNNSRNNNGPVVFSSYNAGNSTGMDPSSINYTFINRMLKIAIAPLKQDNGSEIAYDHKNEASIWITHTKARTLLKEIRRVQSGEIKNGGVNSGKDGLIRFCNGEEFGIDGQCLVINKLNENGEVLSTYMYQFKKKHHYGIENFSQEDSKHKKVYYDDTEVEQLCDLLEEYYKAMSGGPAYAIMDAQSFTQTRQETKLDLVMSKLGIEYRQGTTSRSSSQQSFFNNNSSEQGRSMRSSAIEDLE